MEPWPDDLLEPTPRFSKTMRIIAIVVIVAMILLAIIPVIIRVRRSAPPTTTVPTVVAVAWNQWFVPEPATGA